MRKFFIFLLLVLTAAVLSAQQGIMLLGGGYLEHNHQYDYESGDPQNSSGLPNSDFSDTWRSWGIESTQFIKGRDNSGIYNSTMLFFPENLSRDGSSAKDFKEFRLGVNNISGIGVNTGTGRLGIIGGGGLHWDIMYMNKYPKTTDSRYFLINLGLGGGGHVYYMLDEKVNIHVGAIWWWDPFQIRSSSSKDISDHFAFKSGWGYKVTAGIGWKISLRQA